MLTPGPVAPLRNFSDRAFVSCAYARESMRWLFALVAVFGFLAWDISANNGHYVHQLGDMVDDFEQRLGLP